MWLKTFRPAVEGWSRASKFKSLDGYEMSGAKGSEENDVPYVVLGVLGLVLMLGMYLGWKLRGATMRKEEAASKYQSEGDLENVSFTPCSCQGFNKAQETTNKYQSEGEDVSCTPCNKTLRTRKTTLPDGKLVYVSEQGECYHYKRNCKGLNNARHISERRPCKICAEGR